MNSTQGISAPFALIFGILYLIEGIWGQFSTVTFGMFRTNPLHSFSHIIFGVLGIYAARSTYARLWCLLVGPIVLVVGALWFVPALNGLIESMMNINRAVAIMNIVVGMVLILVGRASHVRGGR